LILVDSNIFLIDRFFKRDNRFCENERFVKRLSRIDAYLSIFTLLELCGIASFNLSPDELRLWFFDFSTVYDVKILEPSFDRSISGGELFDTFLIHLFDEIEKKATLGDALILKEIKAHDIKTLVTWNKKHFEHRTGIEVLTPAEFNVKYASLFRWGF
jgi:predicted nucleic acid-binding protein